MANIDTLNTLDIEGWPSSLFPNDLGWDQLLKDIPIETDLTTPSKPCKCFPLAIQIIEQLDHYEKDHTTKTGDTALGIAREAVQSCGHFAGCASSICHRRNGMLFIAIFQQLDAHYTGVSRRLLSKGGDGDVEVEVEVGIGSFHVKTGLSSAIGKAIVTTEMMSAASCALQLSRMFSSDEEGVKCQRELLVSVSTSLYQCAMEFCNSTFAIHL
ncbi:hypothetical protein ASPWEDRAFT_42470 [Aspergillus wentii DTO 134E9]|uniref:Uncharacterized protein n=1 Tax=Aspergillus wentii DTO 134E9 TaxID=1073089 RepID=A0A1L9RHR8_ASPWE|nr:uncharacterized protein ASPWEDRAFT_42470 [Aspergillus wentii DTO 134E9]KAI9925796.1 hypothetical protein MW887_005602 [Aspergillus wentii]OJJ34465.1 hypothetical protein ASPWEDRAFT_42470 [Aspergillus wentii DTO 134E9]